ncbi:MAG: hypothetical protein V4674_02365 [Patescibacteria group bacterium]
MRTSFVSQIIIVFLANLGLALVIPPVSIPNLDSLLMSSAFLFSVVYGFELSMVLSHFSELKRQLAIENAGLLSVHHLSGIVGGPVGKKVQAAVETYIMAAIDQPLSAHLRVDKEFFAIWKPLEDLVEVKGQEKGRALQYLNEALYYMPQARSRIAAAAPRFVDAPVWAMLGALGIVLAGLIFTSHDASLFSLVSAALFVTIVFGALLLLDEIDSNRIEEAKLEYEQFNETLVSLGYLRYYPEFALAQGVVVPSRDARYRIGVFPHYPSLVGRTIHKEGEEKRVRTVRTRAVSKKPQAPKRIKKV